MQIKARQGWHICSFAIPIEPSSAGATQTWRGEYAAPTELVILVGGAMRTAVGATFSAMAGNREAELRGLCRATITTTF